MRYTFTTTDPAEAKLLLHAQSLFAVVCDLDQACRDQLKYGTDLPNVTAALEWMRGVIREELEADGITLDLVQ